MMFPDTSNARQSAAIRQAADRSQAASSTQYEYAYSTWTPLPPRRESVPSASLRATSYSARREEQGLISR
jgi:hypothetical protein